MSNPPTCKVTMRSGKSYTAKGTRQEVVAMLWALPDPAAPAASRFKELTQANGDVVTINPSLIEAVED